MSAGCPLRIWSKPAPRLPSAETQPARQVLTVGGTARKNSFAGKFRMPATQDFRAQLSVNCSLLKVVAHTSQVRATVCRIVNELLIVHHRVDRVVQSVLAEKLIVIEKW